MPIKPFVYFDFKDWVGGLLVRPGFKDKMDSAWKIQLTPPSTACMIFLMEKCFITSVDQMGSTSVLVVKKAVMFSLSVLIFSIYYPTNRLAKGCLLVSSLLSASIYPLSFDINLRICFSQASYPGLMNHL